MTDEIVSIKTSDYGEIAYSTLEQVKIRKAVELHNRLMKLLILVLVVLTITILLTVGLAYWTQILGKLLYWLANVRIR